MSNGMKQSDPRMRFSGVRLEFAGVRSKRLEARMALVRGGLG